MAVWEAAKKTVIVRRVFFIVCPSPLKLAKTKENKAQTSHLSLLFSPGNFIFVLTISQHLPAKKYIQFCPHQDSLLFDV